MTLFAVVHPLRGFVSHIKNSANCIEHHPIKTTPIHLKCGTPDDSKTMIAVREYNVVFALDSTL
jgi:hypothetical protein